MRTRFISWTFVLVMLLSLAAYPQGKSSKKEEGTVTFSANTQLVLVPVVVTGKDGQPIHGLKQNAFEVMENGKPQTISTFEEVTTTGNALERAKPIINDSGATEYSNKLEGSSDPRRIFIIMLDALNTETTDQTRARSDLIKFLAKSVNANRLQALILFDQSGTHMVHDFTSDPAQLVAALKNVASRQPGLSSADRAALQTTAATANDLSPGTQIMQVPGNPDAIAALMSFIQAGADANYARYKVAANAQQTLEAMLHLADVYAGVPGRKSLIWVTGGFPFVLDDPATIPSADLRVLYEITLRRLADANIAVYPVDARGLIGYNSVQTVAGNGTGTTFTATGGDARLTGTGQSLNTGEDYGGRLTSGSIDNAGVIEAKLNATFKEFAGMTGGRAFTATNDLISGFEQIDKDSNSYYMLGYYLDPKSNRAGWRKLSVKVSGQDAKLLYRSGFFVSDITLNPGSTKTMEVLGALNSPVNAVGIALHERWGAIKPDGDSRDVQYVYGAYPGQIVADKDGQIDVDFVGIVFDKRGKQMGNPFGRTFVATLQAADVDKLAKYGLVTGGTLKLAPGDYTVHFGLRDNKTGRLGTVIAPLTVQ
jgi:VWFA-related protein